MCFTTSIAAVAEHILETMQENLQSSISLPNNLNPTNPSSTIGVSGSGSFQSHLSTTNSQQRFRAAPSYAVSIKEPSPHIPDPSSIPAHVAVPPSRLSSIMNISFLPLNPTEHHTPRLHLWKNDLLKWAALVYCCLSVMFMSISIFKSIRQGEHLDHVVVDLQGKTTLSKPMVSELIFSVSVFLSTRRVDRFSSGCSINSTTTFKNIPYLFSATSIRCISPTQ